MSPAIIIIAVMVVIAVGVVGALWAFRPALDIPYRTWRNHRACGTLRQLATTHCVHPRFNSENLARCCLCETPWKAGYGIGVTCPKAPSLTQGSG